MVLGRADGQGEGSVLTLSPVNERVIHECLQEGQEGLTTTTKNTQDFLTRYSKQTLQLVTITRYQECKVCSRNDNNQECKVCSQVKPMASQYYPIDINSEILREEYHPAHAKKLVVARGS